MKNFFTSRQEKQIEPPKKHTKNKQTASSSSQDQDTSTEKLNLVVSKKKNYNELPPEILKHILSWLPKENLHRYGQVSIKHLRAMPQELNKFVKLWKLLLIGNDTASLTILSNSFDQKDILSLDHIGFEVSYLQGQEEYTSLLSGKIRNADIVILAPNNEEELQEYIKQITEINEDKKLKTSFFLIKTKVSPTFIIENTVTPSIELIGAKQLQEEEKKKNTTNVLNFCLDLKEEERNLSNSISHNKRN